ncbi:hypothetical protein BRN01_22225 [Xanthomonas oryzae pv. oryzae]|nr:hypothetical protein ATY43_14430 [Xanthomonas oryzae pv. oryzae]AOS09779.1 hypothetical protein ATY44_04945 [Xanthomonas oryzae pv. oryzae]AXM22232.1 hypothetical protein BRM88_19850 [Xanthomonas oryzae pv. oryzae]AXM26070.1 hypothetical protein BRM77_19525 [Xanthomonas oryzae pv. oryzae]AXM27750.1 hypothetical protein BRM78_04790 [Xanthomonas oryzae pv. oryzae]
MSSATNATPITHNTHNTHNTQGAARRRNCTAPAVRVPITVTTTGNSPMINAVAALPAHCTALPSSR